jgi:hypothetical protein
VTREKTPERGDARGVIGLAICAAIQRGGISMPVFLGVILGVFITIAGAYFYDSSTGRVPNGLSSSSAGGQPPMVNWDVVGDHWRGIETGLRNAGTDIQRGWKRITG